MTRKLPPLNAVRVFEVAARHGSFTKAAEELHVTHGAVSRQVALLEAWFEKELFHRSASQITLTDAGRSYLTETTSILDRLAVASMYLKEQAGPTHLRIDAPPTFTMRWLISRMASFQRKHPDVEIRLTASLSPVNFQEHAYDIAIRGANAPLDGCSSLPFLTELIVPVSHVDLLEGKPLMNLDDLQKNTLINYATEPYSWKEWMEASGCANLRPAGTLNFEQMFFALQAASEGLGIVLVPLFLAIDDILAGRLCTPLGLAHAHRRNYYANFSTTARAYPQIRSFFEWLVREGQGTKQSVAQWTKSMGWKA